MSSHPPLPDSSLNPPLSQNTEIVSGAVGGNWCEPSASSTAIAVATSPARSLLQDQPISKEPDDGIYRDKTSFQYIWRSLVAGGIAGCVAKTAIAPLDRVKILFQTSNPQFAHHVGSFMGVFHAAREIKDQFGLRGLFQGHMATLLRIFPYAAIKFMAFEQYKNWLMPTREQETNMKHLLAGSLAGVTSVFFTYPLELIRVRMAFTTSQPTGILTTIQKIFNEPNPLVARMSHQYDLASHHLAHSEKSLPLTRTIAGIGNFYRGFFPTIYGMIPYAGVSFYTYEVFSQWLRSHFGKWTIATPEDLAKRKGRSKRNSSKEPLKVWAQLLAGAVAGAVSQTASYPLEVIRRNMQVAGSPELASVEAQNGVRYRHRSTLQTAKDLYQKRGWRAFFVGLSIGYLKVTPMVALSFASYEQLKSYLRIE